MILWHEFTGRDNPELLQDIVRLRELVWSSNGLATLDVLQVDSLDLSAHHVVALDESLLLASSQLSLHHDVSTMRDGEYYKPLLRKNSFPAAVFNRLVVHPCHTNRGLATEMIERRLCVARKWGVRTVFTEVSESRVVGLESLGFTVLGDSPDVRYPGSWVIMAKAMEATETPHSL